MFAIRCLTTGEFIHVDYDSYAKIAHHSGKIPGEVIRELTIEPYVYSNFFSTTGLRVPLKFKTQEAAQWFANRRLTYNAKRKDWSKLSLMESVFACNNLPDVTVKVEFEVVEIE